MGMFPWDEAFFNIKGKSAQLNQLYTDYLDARSNLTSQGDLLKARLATGQRMALHVHGLLISSVVAEMSAPDYHQFLADTQVDKTPPPRQATVAQFFSGMAELELSGHLGKALWGFMKLGGKPIVRTLKPFVKPLSEKAAQRLSAIVAKVGIQKAEQLAISSAGESAITSITGSAETLALGSEEATQAVGAAARTATLAATAEAAESTMSTIRGILVDTGPGIVIALGIDVLIGVIEGLSEKKQIKEATDKLTPAIAELQSFCGSLTAEVQTAEQYILDTIADFKALMEKLEKTSKPNFPCDFPVSVDDAIVDQWLQAMVAASKQYLFLGKVRQDFHNTLVHHAEKHPGQAYTEAEFDGWCSLEILSRPDGMDKETATAMLDYVKAHNDEMRPPFTIIT